MTEARYRRLKSWARACGVASAAVGALVLLAWLAGLQRLTTIAPDWPPVMVNTALMTLACGIALTLQAGEASGRGGRIAARLLAAATAALSAATAVEYAFGRDLGIDQLLIRAEMMPAVRFAGRPSPHSAAAFLLLGAALLLCEGRTRARRAAHTLTLACGSIAAVAALGHLFDIGESGAPALMPHTEMAMLTAATLLVLSAGVLCARPEEGGVAVVAADDSGGMVARRLLLGMLVIAPLIAAIELGVRKDWYSASTGAALGSYLALAGAGAFILHTARRISLLESEQQLAERRLRASEERYRRLVEQASDGIFIADLEGRYTAVNEAGCRMLGYSREELLGMRITDLIPEDEVPRLARSKEGLLAGGTQVGEWTLRRKDGTPLPVEVSAKIFPDGTWQGFVRDITERRRVDRMKDEVIALTSHELQNPLATVHAAVRMLLVGDAGALTEPVVGLLTIAENGTRRMTRLIQDFLDSEKLEAGRLEFRLERVELRRLLEDAVASMRLAAEGGRRITLKTDAATVIADRDRLMEVVVNLISNALKFSPPDGTVDVSAAGRGGRVRVCVRDRGPGIPEEFRGRIFQRFARAAETKAKGTGLGLSISKGIIEGLGGDIGYETAPGQGTTFYFELPRASAGSGIETAA